MSSVGAAIQDEIKRNYKLLSVFKEIGSGGAIGAALIQQDLDFAHEALKKNNVLEILQAYEKLKANQD